MSGLISTVIVIAGLVGIYFIWKGQPIPFLDDIFKQLGLSTGKKLGSTAPSIGGGVGGGGIVGGGSSTGNLNAGKAGLIMKGTGKSWKAKDSGKTTRNYASGGSSGTTQWDIKGVGPITNLECTLFVNVGSCKDEVSIKVYGPSHSGSNCCWFIMDVDCASGKFMMGGEGPHPKTSKDGLGTGQSMGSLNNKEVGIKLVIYKSGSQYTAIGYAFQGTWKEMLRKSFSQFGDSKKSSTPHSDATVQFRTDCNGVKYTVAEAAEITPGVAGSSGSAAAGPSTGSDDTAAEEPAKDKKKKSKSNYGSIIWTDDNGRHYQNIGDRYVSYYAPVTSPIVENNNGGYYNEGLPYFYQNQGKLKLPDQRLCYI